MEWENLDHYIRSINYIGLFLQKDLIIFVNCRANLDGKVSIYIYIQTIVTRHFNQYIENIKILNLPHMNGLIKLG
jgi:hypothetical protein